MSFVVENTVLYMLILGEEYLLEIMLWLGYVLLLSLLFLFQQGLYDSFYFSSFLKIAFKKSLTF